MPSEFERVPVALRRTVASRAKNLCEYCRCPEEYVLSYLASGMTYQEILEDFPYLTQEDILACLSYAADRERQTLIVKTFS
jgi:hypothetical protein